MAFTTRLVQIFAAPLSGGDRAVLFFYRQPLGNPANATVTWHQLGYPSHLRATARDLFRSKELGNFTNSISVSVPASGVVLLRLSPDLAAECQNVDPDGTQGRSDQQLSTARSLQATTASTSDSNLEAVAVSGGPQMAEAAAAQQSYDAACLQCKRRQLEAWRPWDHGFFGAPPAAQQEVPAGL